MLKKILENEGKTKADKRRKVLLVELSQAFVDSVSIAQLEFLFKIIKPQLSVSIAFVRFMNVFNSSHRTKT